MKRLFYICFAILTIGLSSMEVSAEREYSKDCRKEAEKAAKKQAKELKKEKWVSAGALPLESALVKYFLETGDCGGSESLVETIVDAKSVNIGKRAAINAMRIGLSQRLHDEAMGTTDSEIGGDNAEEFNLDKFSATWGGDLSNCYKDVLTIYKEQPSGKYTVRVYSLLDIERFQALSKRATNEVELDSKHSDNIRESVRKAHSEKNK